MTDDLRSPPADPSAAGAAATRRPDLAGRSVRTGASPLAPLPPGLTLALLLAIALAWLAGLGHRPLLSPDEGRYAELAREMAVTGDWVTPRLNGLKYFEKPPLQYWATAAAYGLFGIHDWVARLYPAAVSLGAALLAWAMRRRADGEAAAQLTALGIVGCAWVAANAHFVSLDMGLTAWLIVAMLGLAGCVETPADRPAPHGPSLVAWIGMAGAFLSKGLVGLVIPGAAMVLAAVWLRRPGLVWRLRILPGAVVFAALVLPWLALVEARNPGFLQFFFIHEHFQRFTSDVHQRVEPAWYFIPVLALGGLPWIGHWLAAGFAGGERRRDPVDALTLAWAGFVFGFFSLSGSKLPSYILPMFPALALWFARRAHRVPQPALTAAVAVPALVAAGLAAAAVPLLRRSDAGEALALAGGYLPWIGAAVAAMAAGCLAALRWRAPADRLRGFAGLALATLLSTQCLQWGHAVLGERFSARGLVDRLVRAEGAAPSDPSVPFYAVATYDQSLPFYLGRTLTLVDWRDEMDYGLRAEPTLDGPDEATLRARWTGLPRAYALIDLGNLEAWRAAGVPLREIARNGRRAVIATIERQ